MNDYLSTPCRCPECGHVWPLGKWLLGGTPDAWTLTCPGCGRETEPEVVEEIKEVNHA